MMLASSAATALNEFSQEPIVRFSVLAFSSIFFLVDPLSVIFSFLAITFRLPQVLLLARESSKASALVPCFHRTELAWHL
jgi:hypothetical protein